MAFKVMIMGAGGRGLNAYGEYLKLHARDFEVIGVADPLPSRRAYAKKLFPEIRPEMLVDDWTKLLAMGPQADAVIVTTMEPLHAQIAIAFAELGCHILLEKPMAPTESECRNIVAVVKKTGVIFSVCHVLRYTPLYRAARKLVQEGAIGDVVHLQHVEDVPYWHFTHSFVRGHNHNSNKTSFVLLSKSCHDLDIIRFLIGRRCLRVQSFGSLKHFVRNNKPQQAGKALRCHECAYEPDCSYSTEKIYIHDAITQKRRGWLTGGLTPDQTAPGIRAALRTSPIGLCVYECDNNVCDHQIVNLDYDDGVTANFTMNGLSAGGRRTTIYGTRGELHADLDSGIVRWLDFKTEQWRSQRASELTGVIEEGHGGGDYGLMKEWTDAIRHSDPSRIITGAEETLETHLAVFAAERSRLSGKVEQITY
jgi:predicted dehydrogenase